MVNFRSAACLLTAGALALSGCAAQPDQVSKSYVSPSTYSHLNCAALQSERMSLIEYVNTLTEQQKKKAGNDAAAMAVGMVLFWPALFALSAGKDNGPQLATAKGQYDAISAAGRAKGCFAG